MRLPGVPLSFVLALACSAAVAQPARPPPAKAPAPPPAKAAPAPAKPPSEPMKTSDQLKRESVEGAATTPLRDLNLVRAKIPNVLLAALTDPYARPPRNWKCPQLVTLVQPLDEALGPDLDLMPAGDEDLMERSRETALGVAADFASDAIPFRGWVRKLSGAERHDKLVQSAIVAGHARRAYLKGLGEARGCAPPATPSHERAGSAPAVEKRPMPKIKMPNISGSKPAYPTRLPRTAQQTAPGTPQPAPPQ